MVNCKKCGAPLSLDQAKCPYCGEINEEAKEHLEKLAKLDKDYKKTKQEVMTEVKKTKKGYNLLIILVMLLIANMLMIPVWGASYDIAEKIAVSDRPVSEVKEELNALLEAKEYPEFVVCYDRNDVNYKDYREYTGIHSLAYDYCQIIKSYTNHLYADTDYYTDPLVRVCQSIKDFEDDLESTRRWEDDPFVLHYLDEIRIEYELYLKSFLHLTDEDIAGLASMNSSAIVVLVNERLNNEE
ncbi:MAG: zinc ribbon domain-containing protein [Erysipelotrichaceae bacterium]|nr:zinc ribbon domain-containing protein [Erysipelotrichaceae bacterium]